MRRFLITIFTILIIFIFIWMQINLTNKIPLFSIKAGIGLLLVSGIGFATGKSVGGIVGIIYGLLIDISFEKVVGLYMLLYFLLGYIAGNFYNKVSKENKMTLVLMVLLATVIFEFISYLCHVLLYKFDFDTIYLLKVLILEALYNVFLSTVFFRFIMFWGNQINKCKSDYYELRKF